MAGEGRASNAVDGVPTIVHEGRKCSETKSEKSPWWTVDLLSVQVSKPLTVFVFQSFKALSNPIISSNYYDAMTNDCSKRSSKNPPLHSALQ